VKDRLVEKLRLITGWDCDYCGKRVINEGNKYLTNRFSKETEHFSLIGNHLVKCEEARKVISVIDAKNKSGFVCDNEVSLKEKGYSKEGVNKIKSWGLINKVNLPSLKEKKRIGVVKGLSVIMELENHSAQLKIKSGKVADGVVFLVPRSPPITCQNFLDLLTAKSSSSFFFSICRSKGVKAYERIITAFFIHRVLKRQKD
jgi:hypothetical protein